MTPSPSDSVSDGIATGASLDTLAELLGPVQVGDLLRRAARSAPDRTAVRVPEGDISYAELAGLAVSYAAALRVLLDGPGAVVALTTALDRHFPPVFFGISLSGNTPALVNPLLKQDGLAHVLRISGAKCAVIPPALYERLSAVRDQLPALEHIVLTHRAPDSPADVPTLDDLAERLGTRPGLPEWDATSQPGTGPEEVACIQFTSGTTGAPKAVLLSHRNLVVNAAQSAQVHRVSESSVVFDYLPTFHLMHLTITVVVAGTLVLCEEPDPAEAMDLAERYRATHFYSLPVRLARLAVHPRLKELKGSALRAVLSGGSTLPPAAAAALSAHFGVPVVQGYGLQETSPSTHFNSLDAPRPRSSGQPVAGTQCRIVEVGSRTVCPVGEKGEIQVRGPQLMMGYLGRSLSEDTDAEGWFSTGDIGLMDNDGYLYVVDRIKDVFKRDNWLVSPTEIERVLLRHPAVADCAVVDRPHEFSGAVAYGFVVRDFGAALVDAADVAADMAADVAADVAAEVNAQLPYYEHVEHIEFVDRIPRSPTGKVLRQELRARLSGASAAQEPSQPKEQVPMHHFVNRFTVTGDTEEFERLLDKITDYMAEQPGFRSYRLYRSVGAPNIYVETAEWADAAAHRAAVGGEGFRGPVAEIKKLAQAEPGPYALVTERKTDAAA